MTTSTVLVALAVVTLSCALHGAVGFGMNLVAVPFLAALDPSLVPGPAVAAGLVLSVLVLSRERIRPDRQLGWALLGLVPGTALGIALLAVVPQSGVSVLAGCMVLVAVALSVVKTDLSPTRSSLGVAGVASGFLATTASVGGPPLALVYARSRGAELRGQLSAFFVVTAAVSLSALAASGHLDGRAVTSSALLVPGVVVGFLFSGPLRAVVDRGAARPAVLVLSALAATVAIVEGLRH